VLAVEQGHERRRPVRDRGLEVEQHGLARLALELVDEDVDDPAAHQADGAGQLVGDAVGDELRRAVGLQHLHRRGGDRALDAAAGDGALDPAPVVDVHRGADVERR
jgi:hypothetical protein